LSSGIKRFVENALHGVVAHLSALCDVRADLFVM
jgi:hypothetical protein